MPSLSEQLQEVRSRAEVCLYSGGRVAEVRVGVMAISNLPLPPCSKYCHIAAETMIIENSFGSNRKETLASLQRLSTALNILEKYGCNLTNPNRPKYWRTVKHNNPVFRATVDAIQVTTHTREDEQCFVSMVTPISSQMGSASPMMSQILMLAELLQ
ncbi:E3 ubiquitin-protein ligase RNF31 [Dissostichus eleginoides]|uniref:E3 ubiquitin-protein ligase RNF31 n=1 Tax=Dissostichus eleginoides TaxID=100907 RepID=A0AAD9B7H1_DISEL|nr:E3 ubiquitin-protein ligase RNF31 [Dissostichus eleginoides]